VHIREDRGDGGSTREADRRHAIPTSSTMHRERGGGSGGSGGRGEGEARPWKPTSQNGETRVLLGKKTKASAFAPCLCLSCVCLPVSAALPPPPSCPCLLSARLFSCLLASGLLANRLHGALAICAAAIDWQAVCLQVDRESRPLGISITKHQRTFLIGTAAPGPWRRRTS
jgi:hypothetical protein